MSSIIRHTREGPAIFIGERHEETQLEIEAERTLRHVFPPVEFVTAPDGAKLIPIQEVGKFKAILNQETEKAREAGYKQGYREGLDEGLKDAHQVLHQFEAAIKDAVNQRESLLQEAKRKVLELVIQIAKKVTFEAVDVDREATVTMIERIIAQLVDRSRLKIKVNPDYLPIVEQQTNRFLSGSTAIKELTFESDPRVRYGGCFIETPTGDIDARLEPQFEVIEETLLSCEDEE